MSKLKLVIIFLVICTNFSAQVNDSTKTRKAQITFAYPLGTNGKNAIEYTNKFSFNIIYGINGGFNGVEIGSVLNYNKGESNGFQLGTVNVQQGNFKGFQMGVFNFTKKLNGIQFGVINILGDADQGIPIGIINIVKGGLYEVEITGGEFIYGNVNYKMGVEKFYTIYKIGYATSNSNTIYTAGLGFGRNFRLSEKQKLSIDFSSSHISLNKSWKGSLNMLNKVDFNYQHKLSEKLSFIIGPSFNIYLTEEKLDGEYGTLKIPYSMYTDEWSKGKLWMWIGGNVGLSLKL